VLEYFLSATKIDHGLENRTDTKPIGRSLHDSTTNYEGGVTSMEPFLKKFFPEVYTKMNEDTKISNYCKFDSQLLTSFTSSLYIAGLVASLFASSVTRAFGRKPSILVGGRIPCWFSPWWCSFECVHAYIWSDFAWNWCWFCQPGSKLFMGISFNWIMVKIWY
jgi:hypothetical protein